MLIQKTFSTSKQADAFQWRLYDKYEQVECVRSPLFSETGIYVWRVR